MSLKPLEIARILDTIPNEADRIALINHIAGYKPRVIKINERFEELDLEEEPSQLFRYVDSHFEAKFLKRIEDQGEALAEAFITSRPNSGVSGESPLNLAFSFSGECNFPPGC